MIAGNGADGAAHVDDFGGSEIRRKRGDDAAHRDGTLNVTETQNRMATEIDTVGLHRGDRARGVDGGVSLNKNHASHVSGCEMPVIGARRRCAALRRDEPVALYLTRELLEGGRLEAGENEGRFDRLECGARKQPSPGRSFTGECQLVSGGRRCWRVG